jgi:hypothetical protein
MSKRFTDFELRTIPLTGDFLVGYKSDGSSEIRTNIQNILNLKNETDSFKINLSSQSIIPNYKTITNFNNVSASTIVAGSNNQILSLDLNNTVRPENSPYNSAVSGIGYVYYWEGSNALIGGGNNNSIIGLMPEGICRQLDTNPAVVDIRNTTIIGGDCNKILSTSVPDASALLITIQSEGQFPFFSVGTESKNAFIGGGERNCIVGGKNSSILGGCKNTITGIDSSIVGGLCNIIPSQGSFIGGGFFNRIGYSCLRDNGGFGCLVGGTFSSILGGGENFIYGCFSSIGAGIVNQVYADYSSINSGFFNCILDNSWGSTFIGSGRNNCALGYSNFIGSGDYNNSTNAAFSFIGGGVCNKVDGFYGSIVGGACNQAFSNFTFIGGGFNNFAKIEIQDTNWTSELPTAAILAGKFNYLNSNDGIIVGSCNYIEGSCSYALGLKNILISKNSYLIGNNLLNIEDNNIKIGYDEGYKETSTVISKNKGNYSKHRINNSNFANNFKNYLQTKEMSFDSSNVVSLSTFEVPEGYMMLVDKINTIILESPSTNVSLSIGNSANKQKFISNTLINSFSGITTFPDVKIEIINSSFTLLPKDVLYITLSSSSINNAKAFLTIENSLIDMSTSKTLSAYNGVSEAGAFYTVFTTYEP